jgi:hypothetical protein
VLESFSKHSPDAVVTTKGSSGIEKFAFRLSDKEELRTALAETGEEASADEIRSILEKQLYDKFGDLKVPENGESFAARCSVVWRGGIRRGLVKWIDGEQQADKNHRDWVVQIGTEEQIKARNADQPGNEFYWRLADLTSSERETIHRFHQLQTDAEIRDK